MKFQHSLAVIVGIDNYQSGVPPLATPVSDAQSLAEILQTQHGYETHLFLNDQATRDNLVELFEKKIPQWLDEHDGTASCAKNRLLFYFAGHGIALNGEDGPEGYLIPQDARLGAVNTYLSMSRVHDAFHQLSCLHFIGILDCCFAGSFRWASTRKASVVEFGIIHKERFDRFIQDPAWQIITSAAHDQTALDAFSLQAQRGPADGQTEGKADKHSPFAAALIEALQGKADAYPPANVNQPAGDGVITASELYMYVRDRVEVATETHSLRQTPGLHPMKKHDKGEFIFLTPGHELNLPPAPPLDASQNPYRGLQPFEAKHSELFFGRSALTKKLKAFVEAHFLTVVQGASGAGKSSLVKAGLIPNLNQSTDPSWQVLPPIRPGEFPFRALNQALTETQLLSVEPQNPRKTLAKSVAAWAKKNPNLKLLIFIDQSEEVMTLCANETERRAFFQQILTAIEAHRDKLHIVLSLRSDFEPQLREAGLKFSPKDLRKLGHSTLQVLWQQGRFIVPMMTREELREAIEKPAEERVMHFEPHNLVEQLINEVADMPGALPLLSFALNELYLKYLKRQQEAQLNSNIIDRALTQTDYEALGGVIQSLTQRANQEYDAFINKNGEGSSQVIRHVMLRMVAQGGGEITRRRVPLSELAYPSEKQNLAQEVIDRFSTARLLVNGQETDGTPYVEPAHDSLVRGWDKLQLWLTKAKDLSLQRRLTPSAVEWKTQQHDKFLWHANPYLEVLNKHVLTHSENNWLNQLETEFVQRSIQKKRSNQRRLAALTTGIILTLSGFAVFSGYQWRQAEIGQIEALTQSSNANFTANRHSFAALIDALTASDRLHRLPLGRREQNLKANIMTTLTQSMNWVREDNQLLNHTDAVQSVRFSPDGEMMATGGYDNTMKLWKQDGSLVNTLEGHIYGVMGIDFSSDSKRIASVSLDGILKLWDRNGQLLWERDAHDGYGIMGVSISPDRTTVATASSNGTVKLWRLEDGQLINSLKGQHRGVVRQVKISPTGDKIVTVSEDTTVKLWSQDGQTLIKNLENHSDAVVSVEFSPDGQFFATASEDKTVIVWNTEGEQLTSLPHSEPIWGVAFSHDGQKIASGSQDGTVRLWTREGTLLDSWVGHAGEIPSLSFSPDGGTLTTVGNDSAVKLWQVSRNRMTVLAGGQDNMLSAKFSPNGERIIGASADGTLRVWNREGKMLFEQPAHSDQANNVSFSPSGDLIASGGDNDTIKLWDTEGKLQETLMENQGDESVWSVTFSHDGNMIASASTDGTAKLWNLAGKKLAEIEEHGGSVLSVAFSPDGKTLVTGGEGSAAKLWTVQGEELTALEGHTSDITFVEFSPDGKNIVTASYDKTAKLWQSDGSLITSLDDHTAAVANASFSPDGKMIASASSDRTIKLWNLDGTLITTLHGHKGEVNSVQFSPDGEWLVSASQDQSVLLWNVSDINLESLTAQGCNHLRDYLRTQPERLKQLCR